MANFIFGRRPSEPFAEVAKASGEEMEEGEEVFKDAKSVESISEAAAAPAFMSFPSEQNGFDIGERTPAKAPFAGAAFAGKKPLGKISKLGAVKKGGNFDQLSTQVKLQQEEKERAKAEPCRSSGPQQPTLDELAKKELQSSRKPSTEPTVSAHTTPSMSKEQQAAMERLGMGMRKMNLTRQQQQQQHRASSVKKVNYIMPQTKYSANVLCESDKRTGAGSGVKSMSSDQFFQRGGGQEEQDINQERLRNVQGKTSVSSSQFFSNGADEEEEDYYQPSGATGILSRIQSFFEKELLGDWQEDYGKGAADLGDMIENDDASDSALHSDYRSVPTRSTRSASPRRF